jgi:hypothetical protein
MKSSGLESEIPRLFILGDSDEALHIKNVIELSFLGPEAAPEVLKNMNERAMLSSMIRR